MTLVVIDASVALSWILSTQATRAADAIRTLPQAEFIAPFVVAYELRNALRKAERDKRIAAAGADQALLDISAVVDVQPAPDEGLLWETMKLARAFNLSIYDACYLELAQRARGTLATRDAPLIAAASAAGVAVYDAR